MMKCLSFKSGLVVLGGLLLAMLPKEAVAQGPQYVCRIRLADKSGSPALSNPAAFLTTRALARRIRLGIAVTDEDRPVSPQYVDSLVQLSGGKLHTTSRWFNEVTLLLPDSSPLPAIRAKNWVLGTKVIGYYSGGLHLKTAPALPETQQQATTRPPALKTAGSAAYYGATWMQTNLVKGDALHDAGHLGAGMLIAIADDNFDGLLTHPGFAGLRASGRIVDSFDFVRRTRSGVFAINSHGMQVLSNIVGFQPNSYVGAAPQASVALYSTENQFQDQEAEMDQLVAALERADSIGADLMNLSIGYNLLDYPVPNDYPWAAFDGKTTPVARAVNRATAKGMLVVVCAGNEGNNSWGKLLTPGDADSALTVGSVASNGIPPQTSSFGPNASGRVKPDVCGMGEGAAIYTTSGGSTNGNGTSYSTPQIAGFAACLWGAFPGRKPGEIRDAINRSAHRYNSPDIQMGYGIPNFSTALQALGVTPEKQLPESLTAYYNPSGNELVLDVSGWKDIALQLYDLTGRRLAESHQQAGNAPVVRWALPDALATGIYLLHYETTRQQGTLKITIP
jgi:subtilisin family serine protease